MQLYLVRHPAPLVPPGVCYGRTDLDVAPQAVAAALAQLKTQLKAQLPHVPVYSSPLRRCASLARQLSPDARIDARLAELDFGSWEMQRWDGIPRPEIDAWAADVVHYRPGGGESVHQMALRTGEFRADLAGEPCAIVICHAGTMRLLAAASRGLTPEAASLEAAARPHAIAYGEVMLLSGV